MKKKGFLLCLLMLIVSAILVGCDVYTDADNANLKLSQNAENFQINRRLKVINTRTDNVIFELEGKFSREDKASPSDSISIVEEVEKNIYKRHIIQLNDDTMYIIEDLDFMEVN